MSNSALRLTYYNIADGVCAFSTTRHGGTSEGNHASLNINPYCGDKPEHVAANRTLLAAELGISTDRLILPHQTHGTETRIIGKEFCTLPEQIRQMLLEGVDALGHQVIGHALCATLRQSHVVGVVAGAVGMADDLDAVLVVLAERAGQVVQRGIEAAGDVGRIGGEGDIAGHDQLDGVALTLHFHAGALHAATQLFFLLVGVIAITSATGATDSRADQRALATVVMADQRTGSGTRQGA